MSLCLCGSICASHADETKPLTLAASVRLARETSWQARAARFARDAAQVTADREKPVARPTVTASASGTVQGPKVTFPYPDSTRATVLPEQYGRVDLSVEQVVYRPGLGAARERYAAMTGSVTQDYRKTLSDLDLAVQKAYLDVLKSEAGVRAALDGTAAAQRYESLVQSQITAGIAKPIDAETVASQVAEAQSGLRTAEGGRALAWLAFNRALGRPLNTPVILEPVTTRPVVPESPADAIAAALKHRPELLSLQQNTIAAKAGISLAKTGSQPTLSVRGQVTDQTPTAFLPQTYAAATLEIRLPIFDGGKTRLDTREATAQTHQLEAILEDTRQGIALDVTQAWQKMREAQDRIGLAETQLKGAQATATVAEKAYEVGRGTVLEVQAAQREVRAARERVLSAEYDLAGATAEFYHAQGNPLNAGAAE